MEETKATIEEMVTDLANIQINQDYTKAEIERMEVSLSQTALAHSLDLAKQTLAELKKDEEYTRRGIFFTAIEYLAVTGLKDVHDAVKVKEFTVYDYDPAVMFAYAMEHDLPALLTLNKRNAKALAKTGTLDFVDVVIEERVSVSRDLNKFA